SREGHGDGDDAVVKMPTPEKLCFFLQMNAISWGDDAFAPGIAFVDPLLLPADSSERSVAMGVLNAASTRRNRMREAGARRAARGRNRVEMLATAPRLSSRRHV
ncbi:MAG: hypothetical protein SGJ11_10475, partial [Phycisphaerae bacterium]|nr:hypothetical protein [Phycisphaerae bacterium]